LDREATAAFILNINRTIFAKNEMVVDESVVILPLYKLFIADPNK
jgi:hypothetical protein